MQERENTDQALHEESCYQMQPHRVGCAVSMIIGCICRKPVSIHMPSVPSIGGFGELGEYCTWS